MRVVVTSCDRPDAQHALSVLTGTWHDLVVAVPRAQLATYQRALPKHRVIPHDRQRLGPTRDWALDTLPDEDDGKLVLVDDDLRFFQRSDDGATAARASDESAWAMLDAICKQLDHYASVGVAARFMLHQQPRRIKEFSRLTGVLGFNVKLLPRPLPRFRTVTNADHDIQMQIIAGGGRTCVLTEWGFDQGSRTRPGGCATYRTPEVELEGQQELARLWPGVVTLVPQKSSISGMSVRISWRELKRMGGHE